MALGRVKGDEARALASIEGQQARHQAGVERPLVHQQNIGNVLAVQALRQAARIGEAVLGGLEIAVLQRGDRRRIALGDAAGIGLVPGPVIEAHGHAGDAVVALGQELADGVALVRGVALVEEGKAQPAPVLARHLFFEHGFVADQVGLEVGQTVLAERHVGPGVVAQWMARGAPEAQHGGGVRLALFLHRVDEAVDRRGAGVVQGGQELLGDPHPRLARRQSAVGGQVVEGQGDLDGFGLGLGRAGEGGSRHRDQAEKAQGARARLHDFHPIFMSSLGVTSVLAIRTAMPIENCKNSPR